MATNSSTPEETPQLRCHACAVGFEGLHPDRAVCPVCGSIGGHERVQG
jgi:rRNA maturation endonuclease Nob1